jgi:hypothetical protein
MKTMKFMSTWALLPGSVKAAAEQFLAGGGGEAEGVIDRYAGPYLPIKT